MSKLIEAVRALPRTDDIKTLSQGRDMIDRIKAAHSADQSTPSASASVASASVASAVAVAGAPVTVDLDLLTREQHYAHMDKNIPAEQRHIYFRKYLAKGAAR